MNIRKTLIVLAMLVAGAAVFAAAIPDGSTLTLYDGTGTTGTVVGAGSYVGGNFNLGVINTYTGGTATLAATNQGGHTMTYAVTVNVTTTTDANGNVTVTDVTLTVGGVPLDELNPSILARGGDVQIAPVASLPTPGTVIHEPNDNANEHATESHDNSPDVPENGAANGAANGGAANGGAANGADHSNGHDSGSTGGQVGSD